jgi:hypothetical protein
MWEERIPSNPVLSSGGIIIFTLTIAFSTGLNIGTMRDLKNISEAKHR